jgi:hypothetical protein
MHLLFNIPAFPLAVLSDYPDAFLNNLPENFLIRILVTPLCAY